jgi:hypothetical protein
MNIEAKIQTLEAELAKGRAYLQTLRSEAEATEVTVNRIEGAIRCCRDLLDEQNKPTEVPTETMRRINGEEITA